MTPNEFKMTLRPCEKHLVHLRTHLGSYWGSFWLLMTVSLGGIIPGTISQCQSLARLIDRLAIYCLKCKTFFSFVLSQMLILFFLSIVSRAKPFFPFYCLNCKTFLFLSIVSNAKTFFPHEFTSKNLIDVSSFHLFDEFCLLCLFNHT